MQYELQQVVQFLLQGYTSRDLKESYNLNKFWGDGGKHTLSPHEIPVKAKFGKTTVIVHNIMTDTHAISAAKTVKITNSNLSQV